MAKINKIIVEKEDGTTESFDVPFLDCEQRVIQNESDITELEADSENTLVERAFSLSADDVQDYIAVGLDLDADTFKENEYLDIQVACGGGTVMQFFAKVKKGSYPEINGTTVSTNSSNIVSLRRNSSENKFVFVFNSLTQSFAITVKGRKTVVDTASINLLTSYSGAAIPVTLINLPYPGAIPGTSVDRAEGDTFEFLADASQQKVMRFIDKVNGDILDVVTGVDWNDLKKCVRVASPEGYNTYSGNFSTSIFSVERTSGGVFLKFTIIKSCKQITFS